MATGSVIAIRRRASASTHSISNNDNRLSYSESPKDPIQKKVYDFYNHNTVQIVIALLIFSNFIVSAINAQVVPEPGSQAKEIFHGFEILFAILFLIELLINMYGNWFKPFWREPWNWFDFIIVIISLLSIFIDGLPGISVLRLFRAFRVFRLFKRIHSLKCVINGVLASLPGVANAFVVMTILMGIWAIMGVQFYGDMKDEEFGTFFKAMFSLWQVMSCDSWASGIARYIIFKHTDVNGTDVVEIARPEAIPYFLTYQMAVGIIMMNVVVAILLDNYLDASQMEHASEEAALGMELKATNLSERLKGIDQNVLVNLVSEIASNQVIDGFDRQKLMEIFSLLCHHQNGRAEVKKKLHTLTENQTNTESTIKD